MRSRLRVREAWRNVASGTSRAWILTLITAVVVGSGMSVDVLATRKVSSEAQEFIDAGANIRLVSAAGDVDAMLCEGLGTQANVTGAGAIRASTAISPAVTPGQTLPVFDVSPGFARVLGATPINGEGVLISDEVAAALGLAAGDELPLHDGRTVRVASTYAYPVDGRQPGLGYAVLVPTTERSSFDSCWVREWPMTATTASLLAGTLSTQRSTTSAPAEFRQLNTSLGSAFDAAAAYRERSTRYLPVGEFIVLAFVGYALQRRRRLELAMARHLGVRMAAAATIALTEAALAISFAAVPIVILTAALIAGTPRGDSPVVLALVGTHVVAGVMGALIGTAWGSVTTRPDAVFSTFKER